MVSVTGRLANGIIVNHLVWRSPRKERQTIVTGERGAFVADTAQGALTFYANGTIPTEWERVAALRAFTEGDVTRFATSTIAGRPRQRRADISVGREWRQRASSRRVFLVSDAP
ncbi:hypothetical protein [Georgenia yuyongxinii]|uniref:hypothetical protein n=1 Tax=Georgenia yuyongxinii TaxID=2589797 RepID=UPI001C8F5858